MPESNDDAPDLYNLTKALSRWESEGGPVRARPSDEAPALEPIEERLLRSLGVAVVLLWGDLPTPIQRDLFRSAASAEDPELQKELTRQLGRYLHQRSG